MSARNADSELARLREEARKADNLEDGELIPPEIPQYIECLRNAIESMLFLYTFQERLERKNAEKERRGSKRPPLRNTDKIDASQYIRDYEKHFKKLAPPEVRELHGQSLKNHIEAKLGYYPDVFPNERNRNALLQSLLNALRAEAAIEKLPHPLSDTERAAFRAGWHLKEADLIANLSRSRTKEMNQKTATSKRGSRKKPRYIQERFNDAVEDWIEDNPGSSTTDFWGWFSDEAEVYQLEVDKGETPEKRDSWKIYLKGTDEVASGRTARGWLAEILK